MTLIRLKDDAGNRGHDGSEDESAKSTGNPSTGRQLLLYH